MPAKSWYGLWLPELNFKIECRARFRNLATNALSRLPIAKADRSTTYDQVPVLKINPETFKVVYDVQIENAEKKQRIIVYGKENLFCICERSSQYPTRSRSLKNTPAFHELIISQVKDNKICIAAAAVRPQKKSFS